MRHYRADLHIHSVLSPCADLDMSPANIINEALNKGLNIIGMTDHNTTRHCGLISRLAEKKGIFVMQGAEITTKEEVHCLTFFENMDTLTRFQNFIDENLPFILNDPSKFGYQVEVDEDENIIYEEKRLLLNALKKNLKEVEDFAHSLNGIFIPAHINRKKYSVYSQLGFIPPDLNADAVEISKDLSPTQFKTAHPEVGKFQIIKCSDAHYINDIGSAATSFEIEQLSFEEIKMALKNINGRKVNPE